MKPPQTFIKFYIQPPPKSKTGKFGILKLLIDLNGAIEHAIASEKNTLFFKLSDISDPQNIVEIYSQAELSHPNEFIKIEQITTDFADRIFELTMFAPKTKITQNQMGLSWFVLFSGLIFTWLLGYIFLLMSARRRYVESIVHQRTQHIEQTQQQLKDRNTLLEMAEKLVNIGHWRLNTNTNEVFWSPQIYAIHGVDPEHYRPNLETAIDFYHQDDQEIVKASIEDAVKNKQKFHFEARIIQPSGKQITVSSIGAPEYSDTGKIEAIFGVFQDITERKNAEAALLAANAELEEFAYRTSHDLRSPLVSSLSLVGLVNNAISNNDIEHATKGLDHIDRSLRKLENLVLDILTLTQAKNKEEDKAEININEIIESALDKLSSMEGFSAIEIQKQLEFTAPLTSKPQRIQLIIENFISNAIKYYDPSKENPFIKITTQKTKHNFIFEVKDNGLGIDPSHHDKLFTMFNRFHPKTSFGSGLGLYMIKKSADIIGGWVEYEDTGNGSLFRLTVPL